MPIPVHPDDPLARCSFCPSVFVVRTPSDRSFLAAHEAACPSNPSAAVPTTPAFTGTIQATPTSIFYTPDTATTSTTTYIL